MDSVAVSSDDEQIDNCTGQHGKPTRQINTARNKLCLPHNNKIFTHDNSENVSGKLSSVHNDAELLL